MTLFLNWENPEAADSLPILQKLIDDNPGIKEKVEEIFLSQLESFDYEDVASSIQFDLESLDVHDLWDRSGQNQYGYVEPSEEAATMVEEIIESYVDDLKQYLDMQLWESGMKYCIRLIPGFTNFIMNLKQSLRIGLKVSHIASVMMFSHFGKMLATTPTSKILLKKECPLWSESFLEIRTG